MLLTPINNIYFCHVLEIKLYVNHTVIMLPGSTVDCNCCLVLYDFFVWTVCLSDVYDTVKRNFPLGTLSLRKEYEHAVL